MSDYYNNTRGPVSITLRGGGSASIGPKTWCFVAPEDEGTASLADAVRKGFLSRAIVPITAPTVVPKVVVVQPLPVVVPTPVADEVVLPVAVVSAPSVSPVSVDTEPSSTVPPKQYRKNKNF